MFSESSGTDDLKSVATKLNHSIEHTNDKFDQYNMDYVSNFGEHRRTQDQLRADMRMNDLTLQQVLASSRQHTGNISDLDKRLGNTEKSLVDLGRFYHMRICNSSSVNTCFVRKTHSFARFGLP